MPAISIAKTPGGDKAILADLEIHDVCDKCNNGPLSELDAYFCRLNTNYFSKIIHPGDCVRFQYNFQFLLRALLKILHNVVRARKWPRENWQETSQYIVGKIEHSTGFRIFLQLLIATPAKKTALPVSPGTKEIPPLAANAYLCDVSDLPGVKSGYWISIWSYRFFLLQENDQTPPNIRKRSLAKWLKGTRGAYELKVGGQATLYASSVDVLSTLKDSRVFQDQLSKARKLHGDRNNRGRNPKPKTYPLF